MWKQLWNFVSGNASSVVEKVEDAVDEYFYTDEEKSRDKEGIEEKRNQFKAKMAEITKELTESQSNFKLEIERLIAEREQRIHDTYRAEMSTSKDIILAELNQSDKYTKRARPTVIYVGLIFVFMEMLGIRIAVLEYSEASTAVVESSTTILTSFLYMWGTVVGAYAVGRTVEKRGISNTITKLATGNHPGNSDQLAKSIEDKVKETIKW